MFARKTNTNLDCIDQEIPFAAYNQRCSHGYTFKPGCKKAYIVFCNFSIHGYTSSSKSPQHAIFQVFVVHRFTIRFKNLLGFKLLIYLPCDYSVLTPHLKEEVKFSTKELNASQDYVSIGFYMEKIFPGNVL